MVQESEISRCFGGEDGCQLSHFRPDIYGSSSRFQTGKKKGARGPGPFHRKASWKVQGAPSFKEFLEVNNWQHLLYSPSEVKFLFTNHDEMGNFKANVRGFLCAQVGCFERRHQTEIYCAVLHQPLSFEKQQDLT